MGTYSFVIWVAILVFPILAFLITLPYMIKNYRKYGSIPLLRTLVIYSFALYMLTAYFLVILPLPSISEVRQLTTPWVDLQPFKFVSDIINHSGFVLTDFSTYLPALANSVVYVNLFNLLLTLPFGVYLRYYFKKDWKEVILYSFLLSLFYELTQITALYGIYPRPYRLFQVDDLIINTLGGLVGYLLTPLFCFILPSREKLDEIAYENGQKVSLSRRAIACLIDYVVFNIIILALKVAFDFELGFGIYSWSYLFYILISVCLFKGKTIGKSWVKIRVVNKDFKDAKIYQLLARYTFQFILYFKAFDIVAWGVNTYSSDILSVIELIVFILLVAVYIKTLWDIIMHKDQLVYELLSNTRNASTIEYKSKEEIVQNEEIGETSLN